MSQLAPCQQALSCLSLGVVKPDTTLLTEQDAAKILDLKPSTLQRWRSEKWTELPYIKIRHLVRYQLSDILEFLERNRVGGAAR